jgi:hypothetical protein
MFRQVIIPTENKLTLQLPNEMIGKRVEIIAKSIDTPSISSKEKERKEVRNIFKDCRVSLSDFIFDRDDANDYNG